jgi:hypothetical protein
MRQGLTTSTRMPSLKHSKQLDHLEGLRDGEAVSTNERTSRGIKYTGFANSKQRSGRCKTCRTINKSEVVAYTVAAASSETNFFWSLFVIFSSPFLAPYPSKVSGGAVWISLLPYLLQKPSFEKGPWRCRLGDPFFLLTP